MSVQTIFYHLEIWLLIMLLDQMILQNGWCFWFGFFFCFKLKFLFPAVFIVSRMQDMVYLQQCYTEEPPQPECFMHADAFLAQGRNKQPKQYNKFY